MTIAEQIEEERKTRVWKGRKPNTSWQELVVEEQEPKKRGRPPKIKPPTKGKRRKPEEMGLGEHICPVCGRIFYDNIRPRKYCSNSCRAKATNKRGKKVNNEEIVDEAFAALASEPSIRELLDEMREDIRELRQQLNRIEANQHITYTPVQTSGTSPYWIYTGGSTCNDQSFKKGSNI